MKTQLGIRVVTIKFLSLYHYKDREKTVIDKPSVFHLSFSHYLLCQYYYIKPL